MYKKGILIVCLAGISLGAIAQTIGVKTNLLYGGTDIDSQHKCGDRSR